MSNNADGHELLAVVATVHHDRVGETLNDRALSLAEALGGISASGVREVDGGADLNVVAALRVLESANLILKFLRSFTVWPFFCHISNTVP